MRKNEQSNRRKYIESCDKKTCTRIQFIANLCVQTKMMIKIKRTYLLSPATPSLSFLNFWKTTKSINLKFVFISVLSAFCQSFVKK